jgi:hypothetical protein
LKRGRRAAQRDDVTATHPQTTSASLADEPWNAMLRQESLSKKVCTLRGKLNNNVEALTKSEGLLVMSVEENKRLHALLLAADKAPSSPGSATSWIDENFPEDTVNLEPFVVLPNANRNYTIGMLPVSLAQEQRALWECTMKNAESAAKHDGRRLGCRYHPVVIRLALELSSSASAATYDEMAEQFFMPTTRYLQKFKNFAEGDGEGPMLSVISNMKMKAENRAFEPDSWDMCGVLSFDAMTVAQKISYNPRTGSIVGLAWERDQEGIGIVKAEYARAARRAAGVAPDEPEVSGGQLELSKHYNVYYYNSLGRPDFAFPVARYCMGTIETMSLLEQFDEVTMQLALRGFHVSVSVCDGAGENRAFIRVSATVPASHFFDAAETTKWAEKGINLTFKVASDSFFFSGNMYAFFLSDFPHAI